MSYGTLTDSMRRCPARRDSMARRGAGLRVDIKKALAQTIAGGRPFSAV